MPPIDTRDDWSMPARESSAKTACGATAPSRSPPARTARARRLKNMFIYQGYPHRPLFATAACHTLFAFSEREELAQLRRENKRLGVSGPTVQGQRRHACGEGL